MEFIGRYVGAALVSFSSEFAHHLHTEFSWVEAAAGCE